MAALTDIVNLRGYLKLSRDNAADWTVIAGEAQKCAWPVHSRVLADRSSWFKKIVESNFKEAEEKTIKFPEESAADVARLIIWMYYGQVPYHPDLEIDLEDDSGGFTSHQQLYHLTFSKSLTVQEMLQDDPDAVEALKAESGDNLAVSHASRALKMHDLAEKYDIPKLRDHVTFFLEGLIVGSPGVFWRVWDYVRANKAVPVIDTNKLNNMVQKAMMDDLEILRKDDRFQELLKSNPGFTLRLFSKVADRLAVREEAEKKRLLEERNNSNTNNSNNKRPRFSSRW